MTPQEKFLSELDTVINNCKKLKMLHEQKEDAMLVATSSGALTAFNLCKQKFIEIMTYGHIKEGNYILARLDKDVTIEGYVILEGGVLVLQESDFKMTIALSKLTEIQTVKQVQN